MPVPSDTWHSRHQLQWESTQRMGHSNRPLPQSSLPQTLLFSTSSFQVSAKGRIGARGLWDLEQLSPAPTVPQPHQWQTGQFGCPVWDRAWVCVSPLASKVAKGEPPLLLCVMGTQASVGLQGDSQPQ